MTHAPLFTASRYPHRGVQRKSSFIPVRGFTLPRSPIYARPSIRGALLARGMRLFTRLLSSSHRALVDPQPRVLNQFDRHRHKYTGRANLQPAFAIMAPEVEERKFWRKSVINEEKTTFSFFLFFFFILVVLPTFRFPQLLDLISYREKIWWSLGK